MAEQITPFQPGASRSRPKIERRAWVRMSKEIRGEPMTATDESDTAWIGTIYNVSTAGIALILKQPFEPGTLLFIDLSANPSPVLQRRPIRVVHATPAEEGRWIVGCLFTSPLSQKNFTASCTRRLSTWKRGTILRVVPVFDPSCSLT